MHYKKDIDQKTSICQDSRHTTFNNVSIKIFRMGLHDFSLIIVDEHQSAPGLVAVDLLDGGDHGLGVQHLDLAVNHRLEVLVHHLLNDPWAPGNRHGRLVSRILRGYLNY